MVSRFTDMDRLTPFIRAFRPMLARSLESQIEDAYDEMVENWEQGQDTMGRPWEPLTPETVARKRGGGSTPLIELRQMIGSAGYEVDRSDLTGVIYIDDEEGKVTAHEHGVPDRGLPARPILQPTGEYLQDDADKIMKRAFDRSWARAKTQGTALSVGFGGNPAPGGNP